MNADVQSDPPADQQESAVHAGLIAVHVRYFAGARAGAGTAEETFRLAGSAGYATVSLAEVLSAMREVHGPDVARVLPACSFLLNGTAVRGDPHATDVPSGSVVDVLPPFAGG